MPKKKYDRTIFGRPLETACRSGGRTTHPAGAEYRCGILYGKPFLRTEDGFRSWTERSCRLASISRASRRMTSAITVSGLQSCNVPQAMEEYIKAWFPLQGDGEGVRSRKRGRFQFNISVDMIWRAFSQRRSTSFLNTMKHAQDSEIFRSCKEYLLRNTDLFEHVYRGRL